MKSSGNIFRQIKGNFDSGTDDYHHASWRPVSEIPV